MTFFFDVYFFILYKYLNIGCVKCGTEIIRSAYFLLTFRGTVWITLSLCCLLFNNETCCIISAMVLCLKKRFFCVLTSKLPSLRLSFHMLLWKFLFDFCLTNVNLSCHRLKTNYVGIIAYREDCRITKQSLGGLCIWSSGTFWTVDLRRLEFGFLRLYFSCLKLCLP